MITPKRIQLRRTKGWKLPPNTIVVSRPSRWGNPFKRSAYASNEALVRHYRLFLAGGCPELLPQRTRLGDVRELRGKNLACFCPIGSPCHADVLLEIANS